jgi:hypothetical protein
MSVFKQRIVFEIAWGIKAFLNLDTGVTRGKVPDPDLLEVRERELSQARQQVNWLRKRLSESQPSGEDLGFDPAKIVWIFGTGRGGSSWLMRMMGDVPHTSTWNEPMVGKLFGEFYDGAHAGQRGFGGFVLGEPARDGWRKLIRDFVLGSIRYRRLGLDHDRYLVIKEPHGSVGAPLMLDAVPESRVILLVRDPRDVASSNLDATREGSWLYERQEMGQKEGDSPAIADPDAAVKRRAEQYLKDVGRALEAYEAHEGPKVLVRYEDLREDTLGTMRRIYTELGIPAEEKELGRVVEKHAWENIPADQKGEGKFYRKASPGGWREDLSPEQVEAVERITAPLLERFYGG